MRQDVNGVCAHAHTHTQSSGSHGNYTDVRKKQKYCESHVQLCWVMLYKWCNKFSPILFSTGIDKPLAWAPVTSRQGFDPFWETNWYACFKHFMWFAASLRCNPSARTRRVCHHLLHYAHLPRGHRSLSSVRFLHCVFFCTQMIFGESGTRTIERK